MKVKTSLIAFILMVFMSCGSSSASKSGDSVNAESVESASEPQSMLKAFGLKGKVKTLTLSTAEEDTGFNIDLTLSFDLEGNLIDYPDYNGGKVSKEAQTGPTIYDITINNWKWTDLSFSGRFTIPTSYEMLEYDEYNRPIRANVDIEGEDTQKVEVSYSGSDSNDNYTQIDFTTDGLKYESYAMSSPFIIKTININIEYWPENASSADIPTKLTDEEAESLIQKANKKEIEALSADLKRVVDMENNDMVTLINYGEVAYVPNIILETSDLHIEDSGYKASIVFYFAPIHDGKYDKSNLNDYEFMRIAEFVYENGKWKVDDIGWDLLYNSGLYYAGESYKSYISK